MGLVRLGGRISKYPGSPVEDRAEAKTMRDSGEEDSARLVRWNLP